MHGYGVGPRRRDRFGFGVEKGDIVVFDTPPLAAARCGAGGTFVKRVVAGPGDRVAMRNGFVYFDNERLDEPYVRSRGRQSFAPRSVPPGHYFVLGDNRPSSCDSRVWGMLPKEDITSRVFAIYWPPDRIGRP